MDSLVKTFDDLPWIVKLIFCLPGLGLIWGIYRTCRSIVKNNVLGIILGILTIPLGGVILWLIDFICVIVNKNVWWLD